MKACENRTLWAKIGDINKSVILGKDVLMMGAGCHLIFLNLVNGQEHMYVANTKEKGYGVQCYNANRSQNVFAFAEKCCNPRIFIKTFPNFEDIYILRDNPRGYNFICFSDSSTMITLGDLPNYTLTVWNFRNGDLVARKDSNISATNQYLRCSLGSIVNLAQLALNTTQLHVWDIFFCCKKCILTEHKVKTDDSSSDPFTSLIWSTEGGLHVLDNRGCVFLVLQDYTLEKIIDSQSEGSQHTAFGLHKQGILICGPNDEIRHYKKGTDHWEMNWKLKPSETLYKILCRGELIIGITYLGNILNLTQQADEIRYLRKNEAGFNDFCLIYPLGEVVVALLNNILLSCYDISTGRQLSTFSLKKKAMAIAGNPKFPYVAVGLENGHIKLVSYYDPDAPEQMIDMHLMHQPVTNLFFNECGTIYVAANFDIGTFFIIEGLAGGEMEIIGTVEADRQMAHAMIVVSHDCYRLFTIPVTSSRYLAGRRIVRYCIVKDRGTDIKEYTFNEKHILYARLLPMFGSDRDRLFYGISHYGKTIDTIEIKRGDTIARIIDRTVTGHQMRNVHAKINKKMAITWAFDGLVIVRDSKFHQNIGIALPHHRLDSGVKKACCDPYGKYIVSLGHDNVLVCTDLVNNTIDSDLRDDLEETLTSVTYSLLFTHKTGGYAPRGKMKDKCFLEYKELKQIEREHAECRVQRQELTKEIHSIQKKLQKLLTQNLEGPDNEKLDLLEFNLDLEWYNGRHERHKTYCKALEEHLKQLIQTQNDVADTIIEQFWKKAKIPGTVIQSIFANFNVMNYVLLPRKLEQDAMLHWFQYQRQIEKYLNNDESFDVWEPMTEEELIAKISAQPKVAEQFKVIREVKEGVGGEEEEDIIKLTDTQIAMSGSDISRFIPKETTHYLQFELQTYWQSQIQWIVSKSDSYKLKEYFNKEFNGVMTAKLKEMSSIKERNDRLRYIVSEINYFSTDQISVFIENPEWEQVEDPRQIIEVKDYEVQITPYISPSEQEQINARLAEEERIRLLLLADDFRERALMAMMNGVLEVRWKDELKKDVKMPKCMIEKEPEQYNEDDIRAVRDYEEKVKFLNSERERYKNILNSEYAKVATSVRESIRKFNGKLSDLLVLKLDVDAAISQESLKINRMKWFHQECKMLSEKEKDIINAIGSNDALINSLEKLINTLNEALVTCKTTLEGIVLKDKFLEKAFKKDFQDMSIVVQEQASKLYKKRPKINYKAINSATILSELSKCILNTNYKSLVMNTEAYEFVKALDNLDLYIGIPPAIDEATYALICRHRRLRIEYEIKLKASTTDVAQGEATIAYFQKRLENKRHQQTTFLQDLDQVRNDKIHIQRNHDIQIVLPRGLVEINLSGSSHDFDDAILVYRNVVEDINNIILKYGDLKLKALQQSMTFRRKIMTMEWEHKRKRMQIGDLEEKLVDIRRVKMTKEVQIQLKSNRAKDRFPFENEIEWTRTSYENGIQDKKDKIKRIRKQIRQIHAQNAVIRKHIDDANVDVCELNLAKDHQLPDRTKAVIDKRMNVLLERNRMVQEIEEKHHELLVLQTELELLRLRTYPTLKYKIIQQ